MQRMAKRNGLRRFYKDREEHRHLPSVILNPTTGVTRVAFNRQGIFETTSDELAKELLAMGYHELGPKEMPGNPLNVPGPTTMGSPSSGEVPNVPRAASLQPSVKTDLVAEQKAFEAAHGGVQH
jgi:hypothetical protein